MARSWVLLGLLTCLILPQTRSQQENCGASDQDGTCNAPDAADIGPVGPPAFRYWVDYRLYIKPDSADLYLQALEAVGGRRSGGQPWLSDSVRGPVNESTLGVSNMEQWDVYFCGCPQRLWQASSKLRPGQLLIRVPGTAFLTAKDFITVTLANAYGANTAATILPRTFKLPEQRQQWRAWIREHPEQDTGFWLLKNNQQRATGLRLATTAQSYVASFENSAGTGLKGLLAERKGSAKPLWPTAQQYVANPLLLDGRKFGLRLHLLIPPGLEPFRAYIHKSCGFANLAETPYDNQAIMTGQLASVVSQVQEWLGLAPPSRQLAAGHFTNQVVQQERWDTWQLSRLQEALGQEAWKLLWARMTNTSAWIMAAGVDSIHKYTQSLNMPARGAFELFGIDFMVDEHLHPWVTEINPGPSMRVGSNEGSFKELMTALKPPMIADMMRLMRLGSRDFSKPQEPVLTMAEVEEELQLRGDWLPLFHLFPHPEQHPEVGIPWRDSDKMLREWLTTSSVYKEAVSDWTPT